MTCKHCIWAVSLFCKTIVIKGTSWLLLTLSNCVVFPIFDSSFWLLFILPVGMDRSQLLNFCWNMVRTSTLKTGWVSKCCINPTIYCRENMNVYSQRNRPIPIYLKSYLAARLGGIKQKKLSWGLAMNNTFLSFYSPKPRSQVWILIYWKWSIYLN